MSDPCRRHPLSRKKKENRTENTSSLPSSPEKKNEKKENPCRQSLRGRMQAQAIGRTVVSARKPRPRPPALSRLSSAVAAGGQRRLLIGPPPRPAPAARSAIPEVRLVLYLTPATPQLVVPSRARARSSSSCDVAQCRGGRAHIKPGRAMAMALCVDVQRGLLEKRLVFAAEGGHLLSANRYFAGRSGPGSAPSKLRICCPFASRIEAWIWLIFLRISAVNYQSNQTRRK